MQLIDPTVQLFVVEDRAVHRPAGQRRQGYGVVEVEAALAEPDAVTVRPPRGRRAARGRWCYRSPRGGADALLDGCEDGMPGRLQPEAIHLASGSPAAGRQCCTSRAWSGARRLVVLRVAGREAYAVRARGARRPSSGVKASAFPEAEEDAVRSAAEPRHDRGPLRRDSLRGWQAPRSRTRTSPLRR